MLLNCVDPRQVNTGEALDKPLGKRWKRLWVGSWEEKNMFIT